MVGFLDPHFTTVTIVNQLISILFSGKGQKKQACVHRVCTWKNPGGKKGGGAGRGGTPKTPKTPGTPGKYRDVTVFSRDLNSGQNQYSNGPKFIDSQMTFGYWTKFILVLRLPFKY